MKHYLNQVWRLWVEHGTKAIGLVQGTIAAVAGVTGIIPDHQLKYWLGGSAVLTFWRGFWNSSQKP